MQLIEATILILESWAARVPVELYSLVGAFIEEVIAPIPSPLVMGTAGSIAQAQGKGVAFLFILAIIGSIGKTLGGYLMYFIADKAEDLVLGKFGKFFGITHKEIEGIGKHFNGGWRDDLILFLIRLAPVVPSAPVSLVCGLIKINPRTFLVSTFAGTIIRNLFFLYLGFAGLSSFDSATSGLESLESLVQTVIFVAGGLILLWLYYKRGKGDFLEWFRTVFFRKKK